MDRFRSTARLLLTAASLPAFLAAAFLAASGTTDGPASAPPAPASGPAGAASAARAEEEVPDLVKAVLSCDPMEEHTRFLVACGDGNELTAAAFQENRTRGNPFARRFDRWENLLLFDRDSSGTIDWEEAGRYRLALRKAILAACDADRDGLLSPDERSAANKILAEGNMPPLAADGSAKAPPAPASASAPADSPDGAEESNRSEPPRKDTDAAPAFPPAEPEE